MPLGARLNAANPADSLRATVVRPGEQPLSLAGASDHDARSIAERFTASESFEYFKRRGGKGQASLQIEGPETRRSSRTPTGVVQTVPTPGILEAGPPPAADRRHLVDQQTMTSSLISYVQDTTDLADYPNVAEVAEGSPKPESESASPSRTPPLR